MELSFSSGIERKLVLLAGLAALSLAGGALGCDGGTSTTGTAGTGGTPTGGAGGTPTGGAGGDTGGTGGTGGASTGGTGGASTGGTGGASTGGTGGTGGSSLCEPMCSAIQGIPSDCVAINDNTGDSVFGLRMAQLTLDKPSALTSPLVAGILEDGMTMNLPDCNLTGSGAFSWLIELDTAAGTLKTGGAKPTADPLAGYCFVNEALGGTPVQPATLNAAPDAGGKITTATGGDLVIPIFLGNVSSFVLLPMRNVKFLDAQLSPDQNCIGKYNADQLSPAEACEPGGGVTRFTEAGLVDAHITLEDADAIVIDALNQSLCVLLTGDAGTGTPKKCQRDPNTNAILAKGDWCSATDSAGGCMDSMKATGGFAASAVTITGDCP